MSANTAIDLFNTQAHNPSFRSVRASLATAATPIDFCVPVNRYFPPPELMQQIKDALPDLVKYYPDYAETHQQALSKLVQIPAENIVVANGSTELITLLCQSAAAPFATSVPTFGQWTDLPPRHNVDCRFIQRQQEHNYRLSVEQIIAHVREHAIRTLVLSNPNNPTGAVLSLPDIKQLTTELKDLDRIIIDESFIDFSRVESAVQHAMNEQNVIVVKSLGKSLGWHGVRLGYAISNPRIAQQLRNQIPFWNINGLAAFVLQRVADMREQLDNSFELCRKDRLVFANSLATIDGLKVFPSEANFLFVELADHVDGKTLRDKLLDEHGLLIRECSNKVGSSAQHLRLAVNHPEENQLLVKALRETI